MNIDPEMMKNAKEKYERDFGDKSKSNPQVEEVD